MRASEIEKRLVNTRLGRLLVVSWATMGLAVAGAGTPEATTIRVRLFDQENGRQVAAKVRSIDADGRLVEEAMTTADDAALVRIPPGSRGWLRFSAGGQTRQMPVDGEDAAVDAVWADLEKFSAVAEIGSWLALPAAGRPPQPPAFHAPLDRDEAARAIEMLGADRMARLAEERKEEMAAKAITLGDKTLRWEERTFGKAPAGGRSLWISMHGGGGTTPETNDGQWRNQIRLYQPDEGIYVAPRAPTDTWNLWHEGHIDPLFQRLIESHVALRDVDPDKVYLMGYSAGGDGVWQLAPRMADRFAAAAMMAGHPNEASLLGLRNLPFAIFMGENDSAYERNRIAADRTAELARLHEADPGGYVHFSRIYRGLGHWMDGKDKEALPWMAEFKRDPWPATIIWLQDDITHDRFYWLKIPDRSAARAGQRITAAAKGQTVRLDGDVPAGTEVRLSDRLLDLDRPVTVIVNGEPLPPVVPRRTAATILSILEERADLPAAATAVITLP